MNYLLGFLVYLPAVLAGGLLVHHLWHGTQPSRLLFKFGLGIGLGLGLTSLITFLILLLANRLVGFMTIQIMLLLCGLFLTWRNWKSNPLLPERFTFTRLQKILLGIFILALLVTASAYAIYAAMTPTGRFDAWMIYNRTARFIYRDPANWQNTLSPELYWLFHADYPLLIPVNVAGAWNTLGSEIMRAPQAQSAYFLLGIFCLLMGAIAHLRTTGQSFLAGIALLAMPVFYYTAAREEADLTVAFFILATLALLFLYSNDRKPALIALAGLTAGLAAWTKNEGLLFLLTGSLAWVILLYKQGQLAHLKRYTLGLALPLAVIAYFKLFLTPPNDLFDTAGSAGLLERLTNFERYPAIAWYFYQQIFNFGNGNLTILLIAIYGMIVGLDKSNSRRQPVLAASVAVLLQLAGYFLVYTLSPHDIDWHLRTSMYRLMVHVFPAMLFLFFVSIAEPETIFATEQKPSIFRNF
jgi:hypothetical protein